MNRRTERRLLVEDRVQLLLVADIRLVERDVLARDLLDWRESLKSLDDVFELIMQIFDGINAALEKFRKATDTPDFRAMSLKTEELMLENSTEGKMFLELWFRWANDGGSKTSFDSWCKSRLNEEEKTE